MAFEAMRTAGWMLDEELPVSPMRRAMAARRCFWTPPTVSAVEDLLAADRRLSGNDACVVLAEALSPDGTEAGFARMMTERAQQMGMMNSTFANSSGWPAAGHRMSMQIWAFWPIA